MEDPLALIREQTARVVALEAENAALRAENAALMKTVRALTERVAELERALGSGGGRGGQGTPPPTRPPSKRPRGGQPGHRGRRRARPEHIDQTREHPIEASCPRCGGAVSLSEKVTERFEFEAIERTLQIIRHVLHRGWCSHCKRRVKVRAPFALPDSDYGPRAHATLAAVRRRELRTWPGELVGELVDPAAGTRCSRYAAAANEEG